MAKAKKLPKLTDEELIAPLPAIAADVSGALSAPKYNFAAQKEFLSVRINQVLSEELTERNLERIKVLKKGVASWRTSFEKEAKAYMDASFKAPMNLFKAASNEVLAEIDTMESKLDEVLDKEEQKRIDNLNVMFDSIEEDLQEEFNLPENYKERVERKKSYYNKTAKMADVANDFRCQYADLAKEYKNYQSAVKTITSLCSSDKRLNTEMYINHLSYSELAEIIDEINAEKERLAAIDNPIEDKSLEPEADGKIHIGVKADIKEAEHSPLTKTMTLSITYPVDCADDLSKIFAQLQQQGIKLKVISCVENVPKLPVF